MQRTIVTCPGSHKVLPGPCGAPFREEELFAWCRLFLGARRATRNNLRANNSGRALFVKRGRKRGYLF